MQPREQPAARPSTWRVSHEPSWRPPTPPRSGWLAGQAIGRSMPQTKTIIASCGTVMSNPRAAQPAADRSLDALRSYLSDTAQRELDALRAALDIRLAALEDALAHPDQEKSLEDLVLDLARVATAEAESSAARAVLDAQLHAHERAAAVSADALRSLEAEREITNTLRLALEQAGTAVDAEREAGVRLGREIGDVRAALESEGRSVAAHDRDLEQARAALVTERKAGVALRRGVEEAQSALKSERANSAALD